MFKCLLVALLLWASCSIVQSFPVKNQTRDPLENDYLFEGDLAIPEELIEEYYGKFNVTREKRAAISDTNYLWPDGRVYYQYDTYLATKFYNLIRSAIQEYEDKTCLQFDYVPSPSQTDFIEFNSSNDDRCYSTSVGRMGGKQVIHLGPDCDSTRTVIHEIGHAIGFWHEQSRPDRDGYVDINVQNINTTQTSQFMRRNVNEVDSRGHTYDYASVMHYPATAFSKNGSPTIAVNNPTEYANQGSPNLGHGNHLSNGDYTQINTMYFTPSRLKIYPRSGHNLPDGDSAFNVGDPYLKIVAYECSGDSMSLTTSVIAGTINPVWPMDEMLDFGNRTWKNFTVHVFDEDDGFFTGSDDELCNEQTIRITPGHNVNIPPIQCGMGSVRIEYDA